MVEESRRATYTIQALDHLVYELFYKNNKYDDAFDQSISAHKLVTGWSRNDSSPQSSKDQRNMMLLLVLGYTGDFKRVDLDEERIKDLILLASNCILAYAAEMSPQTEVLLRGLHGESFKASSYNQNDLKFIGYVIRFLTECVENIAIHNQLKPIILRLFTTPTWFFDGYEFANQVSASNPAIYDAVEKIVTVYRTVDIRIAQAAEDAKTQNIPVAELLPKSVLIWHYARLLMRHGLCEILLTIDDHLEDDLLQQRLTIAERVLELLASCSRQPTIRASMQQLATYIQLDARLEFSPRLTRYSQFFLSRLRDLMSLDNGPTKSRLIRSADDSVAEFERIGGLQRLAYNLIKADLSNQRSIEDISPELKFWKKIRNSSIYSLCNRGTFEDHLKAATLQNLQTIAEHTLDKNSVKYLRESHLRHQRAEEKLDAEAAQESFKSVLSKVLMHHYFVGVDWKNRVAASAVVPNERLLWGSMLEEEPSVFDEEAPLALPVLSNQYHSLCDLFINNYELYRLEAFYDIRRDLEAALWQIKPKRSRTSDLAKALFGEVEDVVVERLDPEADYTDSNRLTDWQGSSFDPICKFEGRSLHAALIKSTTITNAVDATDVIGEIQLDLKGVTKEQGIWDQSVSPDQVLYLCCVGGISRQYDTEEHGVRSTFEVKDNFPYAFRHPSDFAQAYNILSVRACTVAHSKQKTEADDTDESQFASKESGELSPSLRSYKVRFDSTQYREDMAQIAAGNLPDNLYGLFNVCIRRKPEANTLTGHLTTLKNLLMKPQSLESFISPEFRNIFLGKIDREGLKVDLPISDQFEQTLEESRPGFEYTTSQKNAIAAALQPGITLIAGPPGTGKTDVAVQIVSLLHASPDNHKTLLIARSNHALNEFFTKIAMFGLDPSRLLRLGMGEASLQIMSEKGQEREEFSAEGRVSMIESRKMESVAEIREVAEAFGIPNELVENCCTCLKMREFYLKPHLDFYEALCLSLPDVRSLTCQQVRELAGWKEKVDSSAFYSPLYHRTLKLWEQTHGKDTTIGSDVWELLWPHELSLGHSGMDGHSRFLKEKEHTLALFQFVEEYYPFELFRSTNEKTHYMSMVHAEVVAMTSTRAMSSQSRLIESGFEYSTVIIEEAAQLLEIECILSAFLQKNAKSVLTRIILLGDPMQLGPVVQQRQLRGRCKFGRSLFRRLVDLNYPKVYWLDLQGRMRKELADLWRDHYKAQPVGDMKHVELLQPRHNRGFKYNLQCVDSSRCGDETESSPHHYVNYAEIEWCLAIYIYMRNLNYQSAAISVLTPYSAQRDLCKRRFVQVAAQYDWLGLPSRIATIDEFQGQQNDYIILSLVRSRRLGHMVDEGRAIVALSRARLGLYIIANRSLYSQSTLSQRFLNPMWRTDGGGLVLDSGNEIEDPKDVFELVKESRAKNIADDFDVVGEDSRRVDTTSEELNSIN